MGWFDNKNKGEDHEDILDQVLYKIPGLKGEVTWADSIEGTIITGQIGSGKTSGAAKFAAKAMMRAGYGFLVLCTKTSERRRFEKYAEETGRTDDLVVFKPESGLNFNFLEYEHLRKGKGAGQVINIVNSIMSLNEQLRIHQQGGEAKDEKFWDETTRRLISRAVSLHLFAEVDLNIPNLRKLIASRLNQQDAEIYKLMLSKITTTESIDETERRQAKKDLKLWVNNNYCLELIHKVKDKFAVNPAIEEDANFVIDYWLSDLPNLSEKTSSIVVESFMATVEPFLTQGILKDHFSKGVSPELMPERTYKENKIIIIDFPILEYKMAGRYAANIYKIAFQTAMISRDIEAENDPKPVALYADEYQELTSPILDTSFQLIARDRWVATTFITQNLQNFEIAMGSNGLARAKSLINNLNLKYFAANSEPDTNKYAAEIIGQHLGETSSVTMSENNGISKTKQQQMMYCLTPDHFSKLKTGRSINNYKVEMVVFKAGKKWGKDKENYAIVEFDQKA